MRRVVLRGLFTRKLRLALTLLAVALGVSLIAATYVFTDTINASFNTIFQQTNKGTDAAITPHQAISADDSATLPTVSANILARVRANPDVQFADGTVFDGATILGKDGKRIGNGGAPNFISSVAGHSRFEAFTVDKGRFPKRADEAALDTGTAKKEHFSIGDRIAVAGSAPRKEYTIVGLTKIGGVDSFGGAAVLKLLLPEALRMLGKPGFDAIAAAAKPGVGKQQLVRSLRAELPRTVEVRTGSQQASKDQKRAVGGFLSFLKTALLAFAGISLFVGSFIIFNSFSITVQQRIRELGLLRTIGANRRQILWLVIGEGLLLGFVGAVLGLGLGLLLAPGLKALFVATGLDLPSTGLVVKQRTVIVPIVVGTLVALVSGLFPAIRATRVPPMAALRSAAVPTVGRVSRRVTLFAALLALLGVGLIVYGLFGAGSSNSRLAATGVGVLAAFLAVALLSPWLVRPLASLIGRPIEAIAGFSGRLARENAVRQPSRTAATAAALMVGVALMTFASVFAAGLEKTIREAVQDNFTGAFVVQNGDGFSPISDKVLPALGRVQGISEVSALRFAIGRVSGSGRTQVTGVDPQTFPSLYRVSIKKGPQNAFAQLSTPGAVIVNKTYADKHKTALGSVLQVKTPARRTLELHVLAIAEDKGGLITDLTVPKALIGSAFGEPKDAFGLVGAQPGADQKAVKRALDQLIASRYPEAEVKTSKQFIDDQAGQVRQLLYLIYALLALAIIVSLFGIVNTLVLSITERTREIGMLRAVGMTQRQVRKMIRWEAVITSSIGGLLGCALGLVLALLFTRPLDGFKLAIPIGTILILTVLSAGAGVVAAVLPARRGARLDVLESLAYE